MKSGVDRLEEVFRALADDIRLEILGLLSRGEVCVCHIHEALGLPQPTVSRHLAYLRRTGLVATRRDGLWIHYRLATPSDARVAAILNATLESLAQISADRLKERELRAAAQARHVQPGLSHSSPDFLD